MTRSRSLPATLEKDDVICYLAERYHVSPAALLEEYRRLGGRRRESCQGCRCRLRENEIMLIEALAVMYENACINLTIHNSDK